MTRPHSDIDLILNLEDRWGLRHLLVQEAVVVTRTDEAGGIEWFERDDERIEITYIMKSNDGSLVTPGYESWPWPEDSFPEEKVALGGITVRAVSVAGLLDMKSNWLENLGEKPRPHDVADVEALQSKLGGG